MSSGIIGAWAGVGSMTYTPNTVSKVSVLFSTGNTGYYARVNGIILNNSANSVAATFWVGAGQTVVIEVTGGGNIIVTALEG